MMMPMGDLTDAKVDIAAQQLEEFDAVVQRLSANVDTLKGSYNGLWTDPAIEAFNENLEITIALLGQALTNSFNAALEGGQKLFSRYGTSVIRIS